MPIGFTAGSPYHHQYETEGNDNINDTFHYTTHSFIGAEYNDGKAAAFKKVKEGLDVTALQEKAKGWGNVHTHMNEVWSKLNETYTKLFVDGAWSGDDADKASKTFRDTMDSASNMAEYAGNMHTGMTTIAGAAASAAGVSSDGPSALGQVANYETFGLAGFNGDGDQAEQAYFTLVGKINDGRNQMPSQLEWQAKPDAGGAGGSNSPYGGTGSHGGGAGGGSGGSGVGAVSAPNGGGGTPAHSSVAAQSVPFTGKALSKSGKSGKSGEKRVKPPNETDHPWKTPPGNGTDGIATGDSGGGTGFDSGGVGGGGVGGGGIGSNGIGGNGGGSGGVDSNGVGVDSGSALAGYDGSGVGGSGSAAGLGGGSSAGLGSGSGAGVGGSAAGLGGGSGLAGGSAGGLGGGSAAGLGGTAGGESGSGAAAGAGAAGRGRGGVGGQVAPMRGGGGGGGGDESERDRSTWLQEDDDVWGETDAPPSVIS